ncbi:MAG: GTP-binding protein [Lautropia sp.]|nr:GTP-binding protein [Lautropia sp.]
MTMPADPPIAVTLVTGFLGAGKTSWLNGELRAGRVPGNSLILVNDFGQLNIDADLIVAREDRILRLADGCICCTLGDNLAARLSDIGRERLPPAALYIEGSGVADTRRLRDVVRLNRRFGLHRCVCLVDASSVERLTAMPDTEALWRSQILGATEIVVNRMGAGVSPVLQQLLEDRQAAGVRLVWQPDQAVGTANTADTRLDECAMRGRLAARDLSAAQAPGACERQMEAVAFGHRSKDQESEAASDGLDGASIGWDGTYRVMGGWVGKSFVHRGVACLARVDALLVQYADVLLRAKGWLQAEEADGEWRVLNFVPGQLHWRPLDSPGAWSAGVLTCVGRQGSRFRALGQALVDLGFERAG